MTFSLRPYQQEALDSIVTFSEKGINKQLVVLPTGAGKTVIFSHLPKIKSNSLPMLVLAHRSELLDQARTKIIDSNPTLSVEIEQAERRAGHVDVVVASVATLGRNNTPRIIAYPQNYFKTIVIDEAHHAAAPTYRRIIDYFNPEFLLGVTATPQRSDSVRLVDVFEEIVYYKSIQDLIEDGWLCPLVGYRVKTSTDISEVEIVNGDYAQGKLEDKIDNPERNAHIVAAYRSLAMDQKAIVFAAGVRHAQNLALSFRQASVEAEVIIGTTPREERDSILARFAEGSLRVVVNVGVLTEGFDEPSIQAIILAKPTRSTLLYTQIVGRGTRLHESKESCKIIDIADTTRGKKPIGLPTLLGLPADFDLEGQSLTEVAKKFEELENFCPGEAIRVLNPQDIELAYTRINLFMPPPPNPVVQEYSKLVWAEIAENEFYLGLNSYESMKIYSDALGRWTTELNIKSGKDFTTKVIGTADSMRESFARTDKWIQNNRASNLNLLDSNSAWRSDSPTDKQQKFLKRIGVPVTSDMSKGTASQIISRYYENNPKPKWLENKIAANKKTF
jgi:superfamily II DNA or RNA helicase